MRGNTDAPAELIIGERMATSSSCLLLNMPMCMRMCTCMPLTTDQLSSILVFSIRSRAAKSSEFPLGVAGSNLKKAATEPEDSSENSIEISDDE